MIFGRKATPAGQRPAKQVFQGLTAYQPSFTDTNGAVYEDALIRSCIHATASNFSKLRPVFQGHGAASLQKRLQKPNPFQTWSQFLYRMASILEAENTCFIVPAFDKFGRVSALYTVLPNSCVMAEDAQKNPMVAMRFPTGGFVQMYCWEVGTLTRFQLRDDFFGADNGALRQTMQMISIQNQGISEAVKSAATYRFMATMSNFAADEDLAQARKDFDAQNFGGQGGGLLLFPNRFANPVQLKADHFVVDADQMEVIKANVFDYFGCNEDVLQNKVNGDKWSAWYEGKIEPLSIQASEVITSMLTLLGELTGDGLFMLTANRLQYMSNADKLSFSNQALDRGAINVDEWRDVWNLPPLPDGQGQVYRIRGEYKVADDAGTENGTVNNPNAQRSEEQEE